MKGEFLFGVLIFWRVHFVDTLFEVCAAAVDPAEIGHYGFDVVARDGVLGSFENVERLSQVRLD